MKKFLFLLCPGILALCFINSFAGRPAESAQPDAKLEQDKIGKYSRLKWDGYCPTLRAGTGSDRGSYQPRGLSSNGSCGPGL